MAHPGLQPWFSQTDNDPVRRSLQTCGACCAAPLRGAPGQPERIGEQARNRRGWERPFPARGIDVGLGHWEQDHWEQGASIRCAVESLLMNQLGFPPWASSAAMLVALAILVALSISRCGAQSPGSAGRQGRMQVDWAGLIGRSDIVLGQPNRSALQALPLGNGRLGAAVWSAEGLTVQLNRGDTLPFRYATGQVVLPGLETLAAAADYQARLHLYDGSLEEQGGGMTVRVYEQPGTDTLIVEVTGADPEQPQTATLKLWEPRKPQATAVGTRAMLAESWTDDQEPGASGERFGSLAAITAEGRGVVAAVDGERSVSVRFRPHADGSFRIVVASPAYRGDARAAEGAVVAALADRDPEAHKAWWHRFWQHADFMKVSSQDGSGEYMEALRAIYLYSAAAESGGEYPGSQAGEADLFASARDQHQWDPGAFWHWNLRMQVAANLAAGLPELNAPYFRLYRNNLEQMKTWTHDRMNGAPGICIPETMRFNGNGIEFERWGGNTDKVTGWNCDAASPPYYNARTLTTGAEVSLWIWRQYLATGDRSFLAENFPVMAESARFLLSYEKPGADGLLHTSPTNAHETQWDRVPSRPPRCTADSPHYPHRPLRVRPPRAHRAATRRCKQCRPVLPAAV